MRLQKKEHRHRTLPQDAARHAAFGRIERTALLPTQNADVRAESTWLIASGEYLTSHKTRHRLPILVHYVNEAGYTVGWFGYWYGLHGGALVPERVEMHSWMNRVPYSQALVRHHNSDSARAKTETHMVNGRVYRKRDYQYDDTGAPAFVYEQWFDHSDRPIRSVSMRPSHANAWISHTVHYPHQAHEQHEERRILLLGPSPMVISGIGTLVSSLHLDAPM
ncbi:hypothetical protein HYV72_02320, partial [Candidatus Uhrbacteria bacterium]|nr:hypothetical protein [Candidatus Uhrbacteria bacterium]